MLCTVLGANASRIAHIIFCRLSSRRLRLLCPRRALSPLSDLHRSAPPGHGRTLWSRWRILVREMAEVSYGDTELLEAAEKGDYSAAYHAIKDLKADVNCIEVSTPNRPIFT